MLSRVKKDDKVVILSGKDRGKRGSVIGIDYSNDKVLVKVLSIVKKHQKAKKSGETSRILEEETFIPLSRVMPICPSCKKSCRVRVKFLEEGKKVRVCHHCGEAF